MSRKIIFVLIGILLVMLLNWYYAFNILEEDARGVFGDAWGFSNSFFGGVSIFLIILTLIDQRKTSEIQGEEIKKQSLILKDQGEEIKKQSFANSYIHLMKIHNDLVSDFDDDIEKQTFKGKNIFKGHFNAVEGKNLADVEDHFEKKIAPNFSHYFNFIYRILKYIDRNVNSDKDSHLTNYSEPKAYHEAQLFRAQLTTYELFWIQHFVSRLKLENTSEEQFKNYVEKFTLFKNINGVEKFTKNYKGYFHEKAYVPYEDR